MHIYTGMPLFVWVGINLFFPTILFQLVCYAHVFSMYGLRACGYSRSGDRGVSTVVTASLSLSRH